MASLPPERPAAGIRLEWLESIGAVVTIEDRDGAPRNRALEVALQEIVRFILTLSHLQRVSEFELLVVIECC